MALSSTTEISAPVDPGPNNPCPVLRALVSRGDFQKDYEKPSHVGEVIISTVAKRGYPPTPQLSQGAIAFVATIANGLWPWQIARNLWYGTHLSGLRGGILDKKGGGSRILSVDGAVNKSQLDRMASFGSDKVDTESGTVEIGLNKDEIQRFIDANVARAKEIPTAKPQWACKLFASLEYPVLLRVMGKPGKDGERYLSMAEVATLWEQHIFPSRFDDSPSSTKVTLNDESPTNVEKEL
jgi:hypothetical protein